MSGIVAENPLALVEVEIDPDALIKAITVLNRNKNSEFKTSPEKIICVPLDGSFTATEIERKVAASAKACRTFIQNLECLIDDIFNLSSAQRKYNISTGIDSILYRLIHVRMKISKCEEDMKGITDEIMPATGITLQSVTEIYITEKAEYDVKVESAKKFCGPDDITHVVAAVPKPYFTRAAFTKAEIMAKRNELMAQKTDLEAELKERNKGTIKCEISILSCQLCGIRYLRQQDCSIGGGGGGKAASSEEEDA